MSQDFEDKDHTEFFALDDKVDTDGQPLRLSRAAWMLYMSGTSRSVTSGCPGFVDDWWLDSIPAETTLTALELVAAGLWQRDSVDNDGYFMTDDADVEIATRTDARMALREQLGDWRNN